MILLNMFFYIFILGCLNNSIESSKKKLISTTNVNDNIDAILDIVNDNRVSLALISGEVGRSIGIKSGIMKISLKKNVKYNIQSMDSDYKVRPNIIDSSNIEHLNRKYFVEKNKKVSDEKEMKFFSLKFNSSTIDNKQLSAIKLVKDRGSNIRDSSSFTKIETKEIFKWDMSDSYESADSGISEKEKVLVRTLIPKKENRALFDNISGQSKKKSSEDNSVFGLSETVNSIADIYLNSEENKKEKKDL